MPRRFFSLTLGSIAGAALMLSAPTLAAPGDMTVATFLAKADALTAKGALALLSSDIGVLKAEGNAAGQAYRKRLDAESAAGKPSSCPPKGTKVTSDQLLAHMRSYPAAKRATISVRAAMAEMFIKKYPCP